MSNVIGKLFEGLASAAATRNYLSTIVGFTTALAVLGAVDSDTAKGIVDAVQQIMDGLGEVIAGSKKLYLLLVPVITLLIAKFAGMAASLRGRMSSLDKQADKEGIKMVVPEGSKAAEVAVQAKLHNVIVAPPEQPVPVTVPVPAPAPAPGGIASMFMTLALLVVITLPLGGCDSKTVAAALAKVAEVMQTVRTSLQSARNVITEGCYALGLHETEATTPQACRQTVSKIYAGVKAVCDNRALLTDDEVGNYAASIAAKVKQAQASCPSK